MSSLRSKLLQMPAVDPKDDPERQFVSFMGAAFRNLVSRSASWVIQAPFDTHDFKSASAQPKTFADLSARLARVFKALIEIPYDDKKSLLDVTTVMVCSEFGRTMRQNGIRFAETGTNHNIYNNQILIGGKGVRGGWVMGSSDQQTVGETVSGAHLQVDQGLELAMGRPFDFTALKSRTDAPVAFNAKDYLNIGSIINTIYELYNVPKSKYRSQDRVGTLYPTLSGLLA